MTNPARVAVVMTQLGQGGAEQQTFVLLRALAATEWRPCLVICLSEDLVPHGPALEALGYPVLALPRRSSFDVLRLVRLRSVLRRERIDLVHAVHLLASAYAFLACRGLRGVRLLPSVRGTIVHPPLVKRAVYRRMFRGAPWTLVNSQRGARFVSERFGAPRERLVVVPNGVDFAALRRAATPPVLRTELGLAADVPVIGFAGKNSPVKNVPRFVEIVRRLLPAWPHLHAVLAGGRLDEDSRAQLAPDLPRDRVHFLGPRADLPAVLADLDLVLLTSDTEGTPNVVLEALGMGVPVVAGDVGDVPEILGSAMGWAIVPPPDVDAYVRAAARVLSDRTAARRAAAAEYPRLQAQFGLEAMVSRTVALWDDILRHR